MILRFPEDEDLLAWEVANNKVVFTNGCFDILHPGHLAVVRQCVRRAKDMFGIVVIGVNSDHSVGMLKGSGRPIFDETHRTRLLNSFRDVSVVVIFEGPDLLDLINVVNPKVVIKGGDYKHDEIIAGEAKVEIVPFVDGHSTTKIIDEIARMENLGNHEKD